MSLYAQQRLAWALGLAGGLPFLAGGLGVWAPPLEPAFDAIRTSLLLYGGVILSFLGGTRWAPPITQEDGRLTPLVLAVAPSVFAWILLIPSAGDLDYRIRAIGMAAGFVGMLVWDMSAIAMGQFPSWYRELRVILTAFAVGALISAAFSI